MQVLFEGYRDRGVQMLAVNLMEPHEMVEEFVNDNGYTFPVLLDIDGQAGARYAIRSIPTTYIINRNLQVVAMRPGYHDWSSSDVSEALDTFLSLEYE